MEGDDPRQRQYGQPNYPQAFVPDFGQQNLADDSGSNEYNIQNVRGGQRSSASQRFRQAHGQEQTRASAVGGNTLGFGFPQPQYQMQGSPLQYQPDYSQEPQRQQQFPGYTSQLAPNVAQQAQPHYNTMPQYQQRQSAAIEVLSNQFDVAPYYNPGEATSASGPASMSQQYAPANFAQPGQYPSAPPGRSVAIQQYQPSMAEYGQTGNNEEDDPDAASDARHEWYQNKLRAINQDVSNGKLREAAPLLLELSKWLLGDVQGLGMSRGDSRSQEADSAPGLISDKRVTYGDIYDERLKLWNEFNLLWEALLQRQLENTEQAKSDQSLPSPQSVLDKKMLTRMGNELVRLCDGIEPHGLVDYEMGVAEEQIISSKSKQRCEQLARSADVMQYWRNAWMRSQLKREQPPKHKI